MRALEEAMAMARESGIASVFARASNHFGPVAPYNLIAAEAGFASIIGSNSTTTIAPTGGAEARLGNSPVGFGIPNPGGRPIILDMAVSVVARAKIRDAMKRGEAIPDTWATDRAGRPTTDPKAALDGFLQPIGGYKGYGLALVVDLFAGLLSGAAYLTHVQSWSDDPEKPQDLGHFFILIDTARLGSSEWLAARMNDFAQIIHTTPRSQEGTPVRLPGRWSSRTSSSSGATGSRYRAKSSSGSNAASLEKKKGGSPNGDPPACQTASASGVGMHHWHVVTGLAYT
jgi:LDH2 family malate/lactate/ureidoglycolate dehydrogenase